MSYKPTVNQTRRDWVLTIGSAAVGLGTAWRAQALPSDPAPLPPGVYLPSPDHLGHALMTDGRYHPIPPGCPTDYIRPANGPFTPSFFSEREFPIVHRLTELLLGDAPAGVVQEVAEWIDLDLSSEPGVLDAEARIEPIYRALAIAYFGSSHEHGASPKSGTVFREGLEWVVNEARTQRSQEFLTLNTDQQTALLTSISDERADKSNGNPGTLFFTRLKTEVARGFYTSQAGLKELDFKGNAFYARSPGCLSK